MSIPVSEQLERVLAAREVEREARERFVETIAEAVAAGVPQTRIASALGITRVTLWRWLTAGGHD